MQPIKSTLLGLCTFVTICVSGFLSQTNLSAAIAPFTLNGNYLSLPVDTNGVFIAGAMGGKFNAAGTGGAAGVDFWYPGTPVYNYVIGIAGTNYVNGAGFSSLTVSNASTASVQRALINGAIPVGLTFTREISFPTNSKVIQIIDTLHNISSSTLNNVATLDTCDPDHENFSTYNDVVSVNLSSDLVVATGTSTGLSLGFGSDSGFQVPSAIGFNNTSVYDYLSVVDPEGVSGDIDINLAQNYGALSPGQSKSAVWYMIFGSSKTGVTNSLPSTNIPPVLLSQPSDLTIHPGTNAYFCVGSSGALPLRYQWRKDGTNVLDGGRISGATNGCLTIASARESDSGSYSVIVTNVNGSVLSSNATLQVTLLDHFAWSTIPSPQVTGTPIPVTITAQDVSGGVVSNFTGTVGLSGSMGGGLITNNMLGSPAHLNYSSGDWTLGYSFKPSTNLTVTHVRHYFGSKISIWDNNGALLASQSVTSVPGTWVETPLTIPIQLTAGSTYRVASYTAGQNYYYNNSVTPASFPNGNIVQSYYSSGDSFPTVSYTSLWFVDLRYTVATSRPIPLTPLNSGNFVSGVWSGNITISQPGTNASLVATDFAGNSGTSTNFDVLLANDISVSIVAQPDHVVVGDYLTNRITAVNSGPTTASGVTVTNLLPTSVNFITAIPSQGSVVLASDRLEWSVGSLASGATATISVVTIPKVTGSITNDVAIGRAETDGFDGNNYAESIVSAFIPSLTISDISLSEGDSGLTPAVFTVQLSAASPSNVTVNFATANGTANGGSDYLSTNGALIFAPGQTNQTVTVQVIGDTNSEPNETFLVNLSNPDNAVLARTQAVGTIIYDDPLPFFDDFEPGIHSYQWSAFGGLLGSTVLATNYGGSVSGANSLWFGDDGPRSAATRSLDATQGGVVDFWLRIANGGGSPWEMADLPGEGIVLEYSINNGTNWVEFGRYDTSVYTTWTHIITDIPFLAQTTATQFRWRQLSHTGSGLDHWALDDVAVFTGPRPPMILTSPANTTVGVGSNATFSVSVSGSLPVSYFWMRDGQVISGATDSNFTTNSVQLSDSGTHFSCLVSNAYGTALSSNATMTVIVIPTDWFVQAFDWYYSFDDLGHRTLTFTPDGSANFYSVCQQGTTNYPTDPTGGTNLALGSHTYMELTLSNNISIYGQATNVIFLASEGHLTLGSGDNTGDISFDNFFSKPRISASFAHLHPEYGGTVSLLELSNRVAITFDKVMDYDSGTLDSFQIEMFYDGRIRLTFLDISSLNGLVGLSPGKGVSPYFVQSDLSSYDFCTPQGPIIVTHPQSQDLSPGQDATFSVSAISSSSLSYFWFRDGHLISGATDSSYTAYSVQLSDSGSKFSCLVSNALGIARSTNAVLNIVVVPPYIYGGLYSQYLGEGEDLSAYIEYSGDDPLSFQWQHDGTNIAGATDATLSVPNVSMADQGYYTVTVSNPGGTATDGFYLSVYPTPPTILSVSGPTTALPGGYTTLWVNARGGRPLTFQWQKDSYNLTGQTNAFLKVPNLLKNQGTYRVVVSNPMGVIASDDIPFNIETNMPDWFANYGGTYKGLFYDNGHYNPNYGIYEYSITHTNSGFFSLRVLQKGIFSGYLQVDGDRIPLTGKFDAYGQVALTVSRAAFGKDPLFISFSINPTYSATISGSITCDQWRRQTSSDFAATVGGFRTVFNKSYPCPMKGKYTMTFDTLSDMPGYGHCCLRIDSFGNLIMAGNLADGTPIAQSVTVSDVSGWPYYTPVSWPLYVPINQGPAKTKTGHRYKGSVLGWISIDTGSAPTLSGNVNWRREPNRKQAFYPNGFDVQTGVFGSPYNVEPHTSVLNLPVATATFSVGNYETDIVYNAAFTDNRLSIEGFRGISKVDVTNGRVIGSFITPDGSRTNRFKGVINQQYNGIYGQFMGIDALGTFVVY